MCCTFRDEAWPLFLGAAIVTIGLVAAAFAALSRKRTSLLIYFALFALLYGLRMWMQTQLAGLILGASVLFVRLRSAINFMVPVPAFLFFDTAGFLLRRARTLIYIMLGIFAILVVATLITGPSNLYSQTNNILVIIALILLFTEPKRSLRAERTFTVARRGLYVFAALALWDNVIGLVKSLPRIEPLGFVVLLACLGYVAAQQTLERDKQLDKIRKELEIAKRIQLSILPAEFPQSGKFHVAARYVPMTSVAGDFYDYVVAGESCAGLLIADVSGHCVPAALIASMVKLAATSQIPGARSRCGLARNEFRTAWKYAKPICDCCLRIPRRAGTRTALFRRGASSTATAA
ncbi:MAG TPA: hypothetical protein VMU05_02920 [Dongiaceae bacterium]|nr:hypothetical protein [Dongiaceae bacterium]